MDDSPLSRFENLVDIGYYELDQVQRADEPEAARQVAILRLPEFAGITEPGRAGRRESIQAAGALSHPNLCALYESGEDQGRLYVVLEYTGGTTLRQMIAAGQLPLPGALDIAVQVAHGLRIIHVAGSVHCQLEPRWVLVNDRGRAKVLYLGVPLPGEESGGDGADDTSAVSAYVAPERLQGGKVDPRTDIWSFGVMLYTMVTGRAPFQGDNPQALRQAILQEQPQAITKIRVGVPYEVERIVNLCLAKEPADRYKTATELVADLIPLQHALDNATVTDEPPGEKDPAEPAPRRRRSIPHLWLTVGLLVLLVAALIWWNPSGCHWGRLPLLGVGDTPGNDPGRESTATAESAGRTTPVATTPPVSPLSVGRGGVREAGDVAAAQASLFACQQAVAADSLDQTAQAELAAAFYALALTTADEQQWRAARLAAERALTLGDSLAQAHFVLGSLLWRREGVRAAAGEALQRAVDLEPDAPFLHLEYGLFLSAGGQFDEARNEIRMAQELDPTAVNTVLDSGWLYYWAGQYREALREIETVLAHDPDWLAGQYLRSLCLVELGEYGSALAIQRILTKQEPACLPELARMLALTGDAAAATEVVARAVSAAHEGQVCQYDLARMYAGLGDGDATCDYLERAFAAGEQPVLFIQFDPALEWLLDDPRIVDLLRRIGSR
ncbi:MAG: serine/threonine-protein kinase [bacterium]